MSAFYDDIVRIKQEKLTTLLLQNECQHYINDHPKTSLVAGIGTWDKTFYICQRCFKTWENHVPEHLIPWPDFVGRPFINNANQKTN